MRIRLTSLTLCTGLLLSLAFAAPQLAGCGAGGTSLPSTPAGITGAVTSLVAGDERPASMLVEGPAQPAGAVSDKAQVTVGPATQFFDASGKPAKGSGIKTGTQVKVWFDGAVAESYPVQGTAQAIQILVP